MNLSSIEVLEKTDSRISIKFKGFPLPYTNALRRICLNGIPVFAIDRVWVRENSSVMVDEALAHRLGLVPLRTDPAEFKGTADPDASSDANKIMLILDIEEPKETKTVLSGDLVSEDSFVKPVSDDIPLVVLAPGQKVVIDAYARLGRGTEHAKWNSANIAALTETGVDDERILTVESTGALTPEQIVTEAVKEISSRVSEFKALVSQVA